MGLGSLIPRDASTLVGKEPMTLERLTKMLLNNQLAVSWQVATHITASYSVGLNQYFKYGMPGDDSLTSVHAVGGVRRVDYFWPTLDVTVGLSDLVDELGALPVELHSYRCCKKQVGRSLQLFSNFCYYSRPNCSTTFTNCKLNIFIHCYRRQQSDFHCNIISWHYHFSSFW